MLSFITIVDIVKIVFLTYVISYVMMFMISWYDKIRRVVLPKDIKK
jgi:hypothetical protein